MLKQQLFVSPEDDYNLLINLPLVYRNKISVDEIQNLAAEFAVGLQLNEYQDEVITAVSDRFSGFCPSHIKTNW